MKQDYQKPTVEVVDFITEETMVGGNMGTDTNPFGSVPI